MSLRNKGVVAAVLLSGAIAACQAPAPIATTAQEVLPDLHQHYLELARTSQVYAIDAAGSRLRVYVYRGGTAAQLGHNHVLSAARFEGYMSVPSEKAADAQFEIRLPLNELVVDDPGIRNETGGNFAGERTEADIEGTRRNMLGNRGFDAERFPLVRLRSISIEGDWPVLIAQTEIALHGVARTLPLSLRVDRDDKQVTASGSFVLRQSDFGITPFSALGGLMAVQDQVVVVFDLIAYKLIL